MTISKYITQFIKGYENIKIDTNHVQEGSDKYGLFKSPGRDIQRSIEGGCIITERYQFFVKQASVSEDERQESDEWLEGLIYWIDDSCFNDYPALDGNRNVLEIVADGSPTPFEDQDGEILYQIALAITYMRNIQEE